jgi:hypothetical protein
MSLILRFGSPGCPNSFNSPRDAQRACLYDLPQGQAQVPVLALYRVRWQIELVIKRMKQALRLAQVRGMAIPSVMFLSRFCHAPSLYSLQQHKSHLFVDLFPYHQRMVHSKTKGLSA